jgi:Zn-dependent protease
MAYAGLPRAPMESAKSIFTFSLFGFRVEVRASFLFVGLLGFGLGEQSGTELLAWVALIFGSILWHELGHPFVARAFGAEARIELIAMGGLTHHTRVEGWTRNLAISLAGPAAGLCLGGALWLAGSLHPPAEGLQIWIYEQALYTNVTWSLVNLLPVLPYDGGQSFATVAKRFSARGEWLAEVVSLTTATLGVGYGVVHRRVWIGYLAGNAAIRSRNALRDRKAQAALDRAWKCWLEGDFATSEAIADAVLTKSRDANMLCAAAEQVAWARLAQAQADRARSCLEHMQAGKRLRLIELTLHLLEGDVASARALVSDIDVAQFKWWELLATARKDAAHIQLLDSLVPTEMVEVLPYNVAFALSTALFYGGNFAACHRVSSVQVKVHPNATSAYNLACCECRMGNLDESAAWFARAIALGYDDFSEFERDDDLAAIRHREDVRAVIAGATARAQEV